jgi:hypothetical protein
MRQYLSVNLINSSGMPAGTDRGASIARSKPGEGIPGRPAAFD